MVLRSALWELQIKTDNVQGTSGGALRTIVPLDMAYPQGMIDRLKVITS